MFYKGREKFIKLFDDYTRIVSKAKYEAKYEKRLMANMTNASKITNSTCTSKSR